MLLLFGPLLGAGSTSAPIQDVSAQFETLKGKEVRLWIDEQPGASELKGFAVRGMKGASDGLELVELTMNGTVHVVVYGRRLRPEAAVYRVVAVLAFRTPKGYEVGASCFAEGRNDPTLVAVVKESDRSELLRPVAAWRLDTAAGVVRSVSTARAICDTSP